MGFVLPGRWLVTVAQGDQDHPLARLSATFGLSFVVGVVLLARRN
jgi:hypothetical protein